MLAFIALCLVSRVAYSLNDVFTGRLARTHGRVEVSAWRGMTLGLLMAPLLAWVPTPAWAALGAAWATLLAVAVLTAILNILQMHAARLLPFGVRAAFIVSGMGAGGIALGWFFLGERLSWLEIGLAAVLLGSAVTASLGTHATHEIRPDIRKGALVALVAAGLMAVVSLLVARLARTTDPLLTAWAWEFGAGLVLLPYVLAKMRGRRDPGFLARVARIAVASSPTVVGSALSMVALVMGALGVWAALAGSQVLITAALGAALHRERMGLLRWFCFGVSGAAVSALAAWGTAAR